MGLGGLSAGAQELTLLPGHGKTSFRGLSIAGNAIWVSGSQGTVGKSLDGGLNWEWLPVPGYEKVDFRDIEAFDENTAIIMGIASPAYLLKTTDGGLSWKKVYENTDPNIFLDAMAFKNRNEGLVIGDPIDGNIFVAATTDGGESWEPSNILQLPKALNGEAFFAASGTNISWSGRQYLLVSGGTHARFFSAGSVLVLPTTQGGQMTGSNSIAARGKTLMVASGNYTDPTHRDSSFVLSRDGGLSWQLPEVMTGGYRSCVSIINEKLAVTCGLTGIDLSRDGGLRWKSVSRESFNSCAYSKADHAVYFVGNSGRLGKMLL
ncbi:oxidoreductase [Niabella terrae]